MLGQGLFVTYKIHKSPETKLQTRNYKLPLLLQLPLTDLNPAYLTVCVWKHETHLRKTPAFLLFAVFLIVIISRPSLPRCHYGGAEVHSVSLEADTISEVLLLYFN